MKKMTTALLTTLILGSLCAAAQNAGNLVVNGDFKQVESPKEETAWKPGYCFIHAPSVPNDAMRDEVKKGVKWEIRDGMGIITKSPELEKICGGDKKLASCVSGGFQKLVKLSHAKGGSYVFSVKYRMKGTDATRGYLLIYPIERAENQSLDKAPRGELRVLSFQNTAGDEWKQVSKVVTVPEKANWLELVVRIDGIGELNFKDVQVYEQD